MFENIFQGIMFILFVIGIFAFGIFTTRQKMGRVTSGKHKYIDNNSSKNRRNMILCSILFIVGGIAYLLEGLNII